LIRVSTEGMDMEQTEMTMGQAIHRALDEALSRDSRVFILGEDIEHMGNAAGLHLKHGTDRVRQTPISESAIIGTSVGAALGGMRPIPEIMFMDFLGVCMDQIANGAAKLRYSTGGRTTVPITIRTITYGGGGFGSGATHSQSLEAWLMHIPGLKVAYPSSPSDAKGLLASCIEDDDPCIFIESPVLYGQRALVPTDPEFRVPLGKASVRRAGTDVSVIAYGRSVLDALAAADELEAEGISLEVVDLRSLVPLDVATILDSVRKTRRAVVAHLAVEFCGPGAEIASIISNRLFGELETPVERLGGQYSPIPSSRTLELLWYPDTKAIGTAARRTMGK
jgi:acetoin:2,6-dichlorophenolindophenol oxidoreductase subunit beta